MTIQLTANRVNKVSLSLVDDHGLAIVATAVSWSLYDERGTLLFTGAVAGFVANATSAVIQLTQAQLTITTPTAAREIVLLCTTADGLAEVREFVLLVDAAPLTIAVNSFQTMTEAQATRAEFARLDSWDEATKDLRAAAMREAHRRILRVTLQLPRPLSWQNSMSYRDDTWDEGFVWPKRRVRLAAMSQLEFDALPERFKNAVRRAQLVEAGTLLEFDTVASKRREGVISESIGESKMFLNSKPYLNLPIGRAAYEELRRYIVFIVSTAR